MIPSSSRGGTGIKEVDWTNNLCDHLKKEYGTLVKAHVGSMLGSNGWPDRMFVFFGGDIFHIEFKGPGTAIKPLQKKVMADLELRYKGHNFFVRRHSGSLKGNILHPLTLDKMLEFDKLSFKDALYRARDKRLAE